MLKYVSIRVKLLSVSGYWDIFHSRSEHGTRSRVLFGSSVKAELQNEISTPCLVIGGDTVSLLND